VVVVQTRGHRHWLVGHRGLGDQWGPRGGEAGGEQWPEMAAVGEAPSAKMEHNMG
jgi:hypothetical protein